MNNRISWIVLVLTLGAGCLNVGNERAERDDTVGQLTDPILQVAVDDGLAVVRDFDASSATLWAQAPVLRMTLTAQTTGEFELTLRNAMADAALLVNGNTAETLASDLPTEKRWRFPVTAGNTIQLEVTSLQATDAPWRFIVFADVQRRIDGVQDLFESMKTDPTVRFALISGDLTANGSPEQLDEFQEEMKSLPFPCFATLGNHELGTGETIFHDYFGRGNFSFAYGGVRFTLLDSASATIAAPVWDKLRVWLKLGRDNAHLVMMHIPPLDVSGQRNGAFALRSEANTLLGLLQRHGVDITVYGHVHTFAAYSNAGIPAYISGGGGAIPMRLDGIGRHFLSVDVDPTTQVFKPAVVRVYPEN